MRIALAAVLFGLLVVPAAAECMAPPPPAEYDYEPKQAYRVFEMPRSFMNEAYRQFPSYGDGAQLCGYAVRGAIFILEGLEPWARAALLRHERGHLNGWSH